MISIGRPEEPSKREFDRLIDAAMSRSRLTNDGPLLVELTERLEEFLGVQGLLLVANGTLAMQVAYRALSLSGNGKTALTTPFTFAATESSLLWEGLNVSFRDIDPHSLNLAADGLDVDGENADVVVPVHVFSNPCDTSAIDDYARKFSAKVVYDAAHAFGVERDGRSILLEGDAATMSFHATKVFSTVEGGAVLFRDDEALEAARDIIRFGRRSEQEGTTLVGTNAKLSELHAAYGLALLDEMPRIMERRCEVKARYRHQLDDAIAFQARAADATDNGAYCPLVFETPDQREGAQRALADNDIIARQYFHPCLGDPASRASTPVAANISERILCLPVDSQLSDADVDRIAEIVNRSL